MEGIIVANVLMSSSGGHPRRLPKWDFLGEGSIPPKFTEDDPAITAMELAGPAKSCVGELILLTQEKCPSLFSWKSLV
jgi:hypothetical protein